MPLLVAGLALAVTAWAALAGVTLVGRLVYDESQASPGGARPTARRLRRIVAQAERHRGERGKWRRIAALRMLVATRHPDRRRLLKHALADSDSDIAGAAVRLLGDVPTEWAGRMLVAALREERYPRSQVAAQIERRLPALGPRLVPLLERNDPKLRFWAATLLASCPQVAHERLLALVADPDPNVRAAVVETLSERRERGAATAARRLLLDDEWFVRVHALRALGRLGTAEDAPSLAPSLGDPRWWVRDAAKDALRSFGIAVAGTMIALLEDRDAFVRNGAAEVLQDTGFLDSLASTGPERELRERILVAGGPAMRAAARERARLTPGSPAGRALVEVESA